MQKWCDSKKGESGGARSGASGAAGVTGGATEEAANTDSENPLQRDWEWYADDADTTRILGP